MVSRLETENKIVGIKQVQRALESEKVAIVYIAEDAEENIIDQIVNLCKEHEIPTVSIISKEELGNACGIDVSAATAALLKDNI